MGMATNIIVLMIIMSFALYMATPSHESSLFYEILSGDFIYEDLSVEFQALLALSAVAGISVGLYSNSVSYALFAGIVGFMIGFITLPMQVFMSAEIPGEIKALLISVFGIMYIISLLEFFRGTGDL